MTQQELEAIGSYKRKMGGPPEGDFFVVYRGYFPNERFPELAGSLQEGIEWVGSASEGIEWINYFMQNNQEVYVELHQKGHGIDLVFDPEKKTYAINCSKP